MSARGHGMDRKGNKRLKSKAGDLRMVGAPEKTMADLSEVRRVVMISLSH